MFNTFLYIFHTIVTSLLNLSKYFIKNSFFYSHNSQTLKKIENNIVWGVYTFIFITNNIHITIRMTKGKKVIWKNNSAKNNWKLEEKFLKQYEKENGVHPGSLIELPREPRKPRNSDPQNSKCTKMFNEEYKLYEKDLETYKKYMEEHSEDVKQYESYMELVRNMRTKMH
jgi:hypothetical protein